MSCKFSVIFKGDLNTVFTLAKSEAAKIKGDLEGNTQGGRFHVHSPVGEFEGTYAVVGTEITFDLSKKPFFVPCSMIQSELEKKIEKYEREQGDRMV